MGTTGSRFLVDLTAGRLAKWLRVLGHDTLFFRGPGEEALRQALQEGRVLLTRDRRLLSHPWALSARVRVLALRSDGPWEQVQQVVEEMGLTPTPSFSLCIRCNTTLRPVEKQAVRERVPPYVFQGQEEFRECPKCGRLYWKGSHWRNMQAELERLAGQGRTGVP